MTDLSAQQAVTPLIPAPSAKWERSQHRFGRVRAPKATDLDYPMIRAIRAMSAAEQKRRTQAPRRGATLDQIGPRCVKYSLATSLSAQPGNWTLDPTVSINTVEQEVDGYADLYDWAQAHDEWPGSNYEGTSVRAGQEYTIRIGKSTAYVWARSWDELIDYTSRVGSAPPIWGIDWTEKMDSPKKIGSHYYIEPAGDVVGGHAICMLWYDKKLDACKLQNTWGNSFGDDGIIYCPREAAQLLLFKWGGEAASYAEKIK